MQTFWILELNNILCSTNSLIESAKQIVVIYYQCFLVHLDDLARQASNLSHEKDQKLEELRNESNSFKKGISFK